MRQLLHFLLLAGWTVGCRPSVPASTAAFAETPRHVRCFAGPGLQRMYSMNADTSVEAAETRGPWLVLDTNKLGLDRATQAPLYGGLLVERRDSVERTFGRWMRAAPDSIVFREGSVFPPVDWHFRTIGDSLHGTGVLVHDVVSQNADGSMRRHVSRWPVRLATVACTTVPR